MQDPQTPVLIIKAPTYIKERSLEEQGSAGSDTSGDICGVPWLTVSGKQRVGLEDLCLSVCVCVCACVSTYIHTSVYIYIYIYIHIYIYTIQIHTQRKREPERQRERERERERKRSELASINMCAYLSVYVKV